MTAYDTNNVKSFRGFDVINGEVTLTKDEYVSFLNEVYYEDIEVCGLTYCQGELLEAIDPIAFRCGKNDYESDLQSELQEQLDNEDESGVDFYVDPSDWPVAE